MVRKVGISVAAITALLLMVSVAFGQSGHFLTGGSGITCTDIGTQVRCTGKVAGLGGTTFEILIEADGIATVECTNPAGNVAPGQDTTVDAAGSTGPVPTPRNGSFRFNLTTVAPTVPNTPTCPNNKWTANVTDVTFTSDATLTLMEDGDVSDTVTVPIN